MASDFEHSLPDSVLRQFPGFEGLMNILSQRNPDFLDMCEELAAAQAALVRTDTLSADLRASRRAECEGWIAQLKREIGQSLAEAKALPLRGPP